MQIVLTKRDLEMFMYIFENRVATLDQLRRKFFSNNKRDSSAARNRVRMLYRGGYLRPCVAMAGQRIIKYYEVTEHVFPFICEHWGFEVDKPKYRSESPHHDIRLAELRFRFEKLRLFENFYPENILQSSSLLQSELRTQDAARMQSDGVLLLEDSDQNQFNYAIELETSKKTSERYEKKLMSYYRTGQLDGVLYICSEQQIINAIAKADQIVREGQDSILYYALEEDVLKSGDKIVFKNAKEGAIILN